MNLQLFAELLETYGGDSRRWPVEQRDAALELLSREPEARQIMEAEIAFDLILDTHEVPVRTTDQLISNIEARIGADPVRNPVDKLIHWLFPDLMTIRTALRPASIACVPVILGMMIGYGNASSNELTVDEELALLAVTYQSESVYLNGVKPDSVNSEEMNHEQ